MDEVGHRRPTLRSLWLQHRFSVLCVVAALIACVFVYHVFSDGDFSFLMTLGSVLTLFSFALLVAKVATTRSASGLSVKSLQAYALVYAGRLASILVRARERERGSAPPPTHTSLILPRLLTALPLPVVALRSLERAAPARLRSSHPIALALLVHPLAARSRAVLRGLPALRQVG